MHITVAPHGRPELLKMLCWLLEEGASIDTLTAAFNGIGPTTLLCGCRLLVGQMAKTRRKLRAELSRQGIDRISA